MKKKAKRKPRQWKLRGWVAVPKRASGVLDVIDLGHACRIYLCGNTKSGLLKEMALGRVSRKDFAILRLDIVATKR